MPRLLFAALAGVAVLFATTVGAQMYRWVDQDGRVHYTDTPPPGSGAKSVQQRSSPSSGGDASSLPYAIQQAMKNNPVVVFTSSNCGQACAEGKALLASRGVPFREVPVADEKSREELKSASGGDLVPVMTVGRSASKGFEADMWHSALDAGGYPRSAPPLTAQQQKAAASAAEPAAKADAPKQASAEPPEQPKGRYLPR